jgi:hypothetical protein
MSERGVFAVDRGVWDHPMFAPEPFTEREAWLWLISAAVWKATRVRAGRKLVALVRGQLVFSERFLAEKWKWSKSTVRRFLDRLKTEAMVTTLADRDATLITICNYEKYAFDGTTRGPRTGPPTGPLPDHSRTKEEEPKKDNKQEIKDSSLRSVDDWPSDFREHFWKAYPRKAGKALAIRKLEIIRKGGKVTFATLMAGVDRYASACLQIETQFQKHPATWLNAGCWDDDASALKRATGPPRINGPQGFESLFQQPERPPDEPDQRPEYDLDLTANSAG